MRTKQSVAVRMLMRALKDAEKLSQAVHENGFVFEGDDYEVATNLIQTRIRILRELNITGELESACQA
jgi:hypothetical protein